jgi:DNA-binding transcriptional ArsR family regulator
MSDPQALFAALADPTRRSVYERLTSRGPASATTLASELPVSRQAIAKHLMSLAEAGLVTRSTVGREVRFAASVEPLADVADWLAHRSADWEMRLGDLKRGLEA